MRKYLLKRGDLISKIGGLFLILIGLAQVFGLWSSLIIELRSLISEFSPVI